MEIVNLGPMHRAHPIKKPMPTQSKAYTRSTSTQHHLKMKNRFLFIFMSILPEMCDSFGLSPSDWPIFSNYSA